MVSFFSSESERVLVTVQDHQVSPRFDMTLEIIIAEKGLEGGTLNEKYFLLAEPSAEELCNLIQKENVQAVICGGIEEEYYQYLTWKKVKVFCNVIGPAGKGLLSWAGGVLAEDTIFQADGALPPK